MPIGRKGFWVSVTLPSVYFTTSQHLLQGKPQHPGTMIRSWFLLLPQVAIPNKERKLLPSAYLLLYMGVFLELYLCPLLSVSFWTPLPTYHIFTLAIYVSFQLDCKFLETKHSISFTFIFPGPIKVHNMPQMLFNCEFCSIHVIGSYIARSTWTVLTLFPCDSFWYT